MPARNASLVLLCLASWGSLPRDAAAGSADDAWKSLVALDAGQKTEPATPAEARIVALDHFGKQERAAREFLSTYPNDARGVEGRLRLARALQLQADVQDVKIASPEVDALITEADRLAKPQQRADVRFARLSYMMRTMREPTPQESQKLYDAVRSFQASYPQDRRLGELLAEIATLFDHQPKTKQKLLLSAQSHANDEDLKARIADDLRRVELVGQIPSLRFAPEKGTAIDVADYRGKAVVVIFFAAWSPPAIEAVLDLQKALPQFPEEKVQVVGVSLDTRREPLELLVTEQNIAWPIICDGRGWQSPLVRSLGINSLPTAWLLAPDGRLKSLNVLTSTVSQVKEAVGERK